MMRSLIDIVFEMIDELKSHSSLNDKKIILMKYASEHRLILDILMFVYDYKKQYWITPVVFAKPEEQIDVEKFGYFSPKSENGVDELKWLRNVLELLKQNRGKKARGVLYHIYKVENFRYFKIVNVILSRNLGCGVNVKTINQVLKNLSVSLIEEYNVMLAEQFELEKYLKLKWNKIFIQEKMDGIRVECFYDVKTKNMTVLTRNGNCLIFDKIEYLKPLAENIYTQNPTHFKNGVVLCVEICGDERRKVSGIVQTILLGKQISSEVENSIIFHVFECLSVDDFNDVDVVCKAEFVDRYEFLKRAFEQQFDGNETIVKLVVAKSLQIKNSHLAIDNEFANILKNGGEGVMVKNGNGLYERKRSHNWLKLKEFKTIDLVCDGINPGAGKFENMVGSLSCSNFDKSIRVNVGTGITDEMRQELTALGDSLIGKIIEIKYNSIIENKENDCLSLFLPVFVQVRNDKEIPD